MDFFGFGNVTNFFGFDSEVIFLVKVSDKNLKDSLGKISVIIKLEVQLGLNFHNPEINRYKYWSTFSSPTSEILALHWIYGGYIH